MPIRTTLLAFCVLFLSVLEAQRIDFPAPLTETTASTRFHDPGSVLRFRLDPAAFAAIADGTSEDLLVRLPGEDGTIAFSLLRKEYRTENYRRTLASGERTGITSPSAQWENKEARFTFDPYFVSAAWTVDGTDYVLEPSWLRNTEEPRDIYLLYREDNLRSSAGHCDVMDAVGKPAGDGEAKLWVGGKEADIAIAVDNEMYREFDNPESAESFIISILSDVQRDFDRGFDELLQLRLTSLFLSDLPEEEEGWGVDRDYISLLTNFQQWASVNDWAGTYDVATLWTGRDLTSPESGSSNIGGAYIGEVCNPFRYSVVENWSSSRGDLRAIWSHELGHAFGANHVGRNSTNIMSPNVGRTNALWSPSALREINNSLPDMLCLRDAGWLGFTGNALGGTAILDWRFKELSRNEGFTVERSLNEFEGFEDIGWVPASAAVNRTEYRFTDPDLTLGEVYYYRLRQLDADGRESFSITLRLITILPEGVRLAPNPTTGLLRVTSVDTEASTYVITDAAGRRLLSGTILRGATEINLAALPTGVYFYYEVNEKETRFVSRIVKR